MLLTGLQEIEMFMVNHLSMFLIKILLLNPAVFPMLRFKLLGSIEMSVPIEKSTFDNSCSKKL